MGGQQAQGKITWHAAEQIAGREGIAGRNIDTTGVVRIAITIQGSTVDNVGPVVTRDVGFAKLQVFTLKVQVETIVQCGAVDTKLNAVSQFYLVIIQGELEAFDPLRWGNDETDCVGISFFWLEINIAA